MAQFVKDLERHYMTNSNACIFGMSESRDGLKEVYNSAFD